MPFHKLIAQLNCMVGVSVTLLGVNYGSTLKLMNCFFVVSHQINPVD